jgi:hypothetical protein
LKRIVVIIYHVVVDAETGIRPSPPQLAAQTQAALEATARERRWTLPRGAHEVPAAGPPRRLAAPGAGAQHIGGAVAATLAQVLDGLAGFGDRRQS